MANQLMEGLSDTQLTYIGKKLDGMIFKKIHPNPPRDYKKAAVLFNDIVNLGYQITMDDVRKAIKLANSHFSEEMIDEMGYFAEAMNFLKLGLDDDYRNDYGITKNELEENS